MTAIDDSVPAVVERLLGVLESSGALYAFGGAIALAAWSEPRATADVDVILWIEPGEIDRAIEIAKGHEEGREEGREVAREEGGRSLLERQLARRFGPLPTWARDKLAAAHADLLEQWADRILDATTLEEVLQH